MGIALPRNTSYQLKTEGAAPNIEPALIEIGKEAFDQSSTGAFLRSADEWIWSVPTHREDSVVVSGFSPAQSRLFDQRCNLIEDKREKAWNLLIECDMYYRDSVPEARRLLEWNPNIKPSNIWDYPVRFVVSAILEARSLPNLDESLIFDRER